jgi:HK97 family phage portal protein
MEIFGLTITRTKSLSSVDGSRSWWPLIREFTTGGWQRNEDVRVDTALSNPTLFATVTLIAGDVAKLRPMLVEQDEHGIWSEVRRESPFARVLEHPNHYQTRIDFFEWWMLSKLCHGNTYALKARDGRGMVQALFILDPTRVVPLVGPDGSVFYQLVKDELASIEESVVVPARQIIHDVMCPLFHPLVGVSPIYAAGYPALQGLTMRSTSGRFFANGSKPGGVLTSPNQISQSTADRLKKYWESEFSGDNIGKIAVLGDGLKYEAMAVTADQAKLVEQLQMTDEDITKCFHMPRHKVNVGPDPDGRLSVEALDRQYHNDCLQKHIEKLELRLDQGLELDNVPGRMLGIEFNRDDLFQMDSATRLNAAEQATKSGASPNEVRLRYHDLGPTEGGDTPFLQHQMWPIRVLSNRTIPPEEGGPGSRSLPAPDPEKALPLSLVEFAAARDAFTKAWEHA